MGADFFAGSSHPGAAAQVARAKQLYAKASVDFHSAFFDSGKGFYGSGLQTEQAMPLYLDIVPADVKAKVLAYTINDIQVTNTGHTTSGIIGIKVRAHACRAADSPAACAHSHLPIARARSACSRCWRVRGARTWRWTCSSRTPTPPTAT